MHALAHICWVAHNQRHKQLTDCRHGDFDKQIDSSGHRLRHSALGRRTAAQICPAFIRGIWVALQPQQQIFCLLSSAPFSLPRSAEACPCSCRKGSAPSGCSQKPHSVTSFSSPTWPCRSYMLFGEALLTCPLGKTKCKFLRRGLICCSLELSDRTWLEACLINLILSSCRPPQKHSWGICLSIWPTVNEQFVLLSNEPRSHLRSVFTLKRFSWLRCLLDKLHRRQ